MAEWSPNPPCESDSNQKRQQLVSRTRAPKVQNEKRPVNEGPRSPPGAKYTIHKQTEITLFSTTTVSVGQGQDGDESNPVVNEILPGREKKSHPVKDFHKNPSTTPSASLSADAQPQSDESDPPSPTQREEFPVPISYQKPQPASSADPHAESSACLTGLTGSHIRIPTAHANSSMLLPETASAHSPAAATSTPANQPDTQPSAGKNTQHHTGQTSTTTQHHTGHTTQQTTQPLAGQLTQSPAGPTPLPPAGHTTQPKSRGSLASVSSHPIMPGLQSTGSRGRLAHRRYSDPQPTRKAEMHLSEAADPNTSLPANPNTRHPADSTTQCPPPASSNTANSTTPPAAEPAKGTEGPTPENRKTSKPAAQESLQRQSGHSGNSVEENKAQNISVQLHLTQGSTTAQFKFDSPHPGECTVKENYYESGKIRERFFRANSEPNISGKLGKDEPSNGWGRKLWQETVPMLAFVFIIVIVLLILYVVLGPSMEV